MSYFLLVITAIIAILQLQNLQRRPIDYKAWAVLVLIVLATAVSFYVEYDNEEKEKYSRDYGRLSPTKTGRSVLLWELNGDTLVFTEGVMDFSKHAPSYLRGINFKAWIEDEKVYVSTDVRDSTGKLIARLRKNEWILNPDARFDKNFDNQALEVIDNDGNVVFQIQVIENHIKLQGLFYQPNGNATLITRISPPNNREFTTIGTFINAGEGTLRIPPHPMLRYIQPIFNYPSNLHKGERF